MTTLAVTDAHALLWHATRQSRRLGARARRLFADADAGRATILVPAMVLVEISEAVLAGRVRVPARSFGEWLDALAGSGRYVPVPMDADVVRAAHELAAIPERGDRLVAATAIVQKCGIVTPNTVLVSNSRVEHVW